MEDLKAVTAVSQVGDSFGYTGLKILAGFCLFAPCHFYGSLAKLRGSTLSLGNLSSDIKPLGSAIALVKLEMVLEP